MTGYNMRQQNLEKAHGVEQRDWDALIRIVSPKEGDKILDLMGGNGAVASRLYEYALRLGVSLNLGVMDAFSKQLEKAPAYLERIVGDIRKMPSESESYDIIIVKMGLHELSLAEQKIAVREVYRTLKPQGNLVLWMVGLENLAQQETFCKLLREKDRIAGFNELVERRYFPTIQETKEYLTDAGFIDIQEIYRRNPKMNTFARLDGDFAGDKRKLEKWHDYIRTNLPEFKEILGVEASEDSFDIVYPICILAARR